MHCCMKRSYVSQLKKQSPPKQQCGPADAQTCFAFARLIISTLIIGGICS
ncbi:hypothetical protein KFK09_006035 [Dendrobium nobile]|uniref:Uncharacterized protein n=1 Tax=Dendrobium nobile TaxID=94219 RepID=A0A8T3BQK4_DENNO|nr:hypothetical protein KFK09_006035 [Dendrobium nobile]